MIQHGIPLQLPHVQLDVIGRRALGTPSFAASPTAHLASTRQTGKSRFASPVRHPEQLAWALAQIRAKYPNTQIDEKALLATANVTEGYINDPIVHKLELDGPELFRGLLKACFNLLGAEHPEKALLPCFNGVRDYIRDGSGGAAPYVRWYASTEFPNLPRLGPADQHIFIVCRGSSAEGVAQLFGGLVYPFQLTDSYSGPAFACGYVVDPFRESEPAEIRNAKFNAAAVPVFSKQEDHWNEAASRSLDRGLAKIMDSHFDRHRQAVIKRSFEEVAKSHGGDEFTEEMAGELADLLTKRLLRIERDLGLIRSLERQLYSQSCCPLEASARSH